VGGTWGPHSCSLLLLFPSGTADRGGGQAKGGERFGWERGEGRAGGGEGEGGAGGGRGGRELSTYAVHCCYCCQALHVCACVCVCVRVCVSVGLEKKGGKKNA
jgi:hypothetical protein